MGNFAFRNGLKEIFESEKITKIIHDSRYVSDCLFHQNQVKKLPACSFFDTQIAEMILFKRIHGGNLPRFFRSLSQSLEENLSIDKKFIPHIFVREKNREVFKIFLIF